MVLCKHLMFLITVIFTIHINFSASLTGRTCTERRSKSVPYTAYQQKRMSQRYSKKCGFAGWKRCTRYRDYYVRQSVRRVRTGYFAITNCCPGWRLDSTGKNCGIHDKIPSVVSCPKSRTVTATGKLSLITWTQPVFKEPFGFRLTITSTYNAESAKLGWGDNRIEYVATSTNNQKQTKCAFTITVLPPKQKAEIVGHADGGTVSIQENARLVLVCQATYAKPPPSINWYRQGSKIHNAQYKIVRSNYLDYSNAVSTLTLNPTRKDDDAVYECRTSPDVTKYSVKLKVSYEVVPIVTYCPPDIRRDSRTRQTDVTWNKPTFKDPRRNDPLDVVSNIGTALHKEFGWGNHTISYTATNRKNKLTVTCSFTVSLQPVRCKNKLIAGENGAVVCAFIPEFYMDVCKIFCLNGYDVSWLERYPEMYICDAGGEWRPKPARAVKCPHNIGKLDGLSLPSKTQYIDGGCQKTSHILKKSFLQSLKNSPFSSVCESGHCESSIVTTCNS